MADELLTPQEAADALRLHRRTVYKLLRNGELKGRKVGGVWRVPADVVYDRPKADHAEVMAKGRVKR